ncbi:MAG: pyridoxamine 5'-phosphate oxidase [Candidatus Rokubacteria bacterium 13_1_40CM_69_27]|nr:MAG: pyridoxamine 5'-phosphate oxidase [Candidatus Rokubacteria bacterium 13_1_40CM_69_27]
MALEDFTKALKDTDEIDITVTGRSSGRKTSRPVWFVRDGATLYLLPVKGSASEWYKNVLKNQAITLAAKGAKATAKATPITDAAQVHDVVEKFRAKHGVGEVKKYYSKFDVAVAVPLT